MEVKQKMSHELEWNDGVSLRGSNVQQLLALRARDQIVPLLAHVYSLNN